MNHGGRVLVVDDDADLREGLSAFLERHGYDVVTAANGNEGLERLRSEETIDLILLDLRMPGMDGWGFRRHQLVQPEWRGIPTIVITGEHVDSIDGNATVMHKPIDPREILRTAIHCIPPPTMGDAAAAE